MNAVRSAVLSAVVTLAAAATVGGQAFGPQAAIAAEAPQRGPRFVVNLLDYISADYGGAVTGGKVANQFEYDEQIEFVNAAIATARELPETRDAESVHSGLARLKDLVVRKADASAVAEQAQATKREVIDVARVTLAPIKWPNLQRGAQLFAQNCVSCHGSQGRGDGPAGKGLEPAPANFADPAMSASSPFKSFNVTREGVPGTGMVPFHQFTDRDVWDLAFFVNSVRFQQVEPKPALTLPEGEWLQAAASRGDEELLAMLPGSDAEKAAHLAALRLHTAGDDSASALALARSSLQGADRDYQQGKRREARDQALKAYLEGIEPVEPRLKASNADFTLELEERMGEVRQTIEAGAGPSEVSASIARALGALDQAERILTQAKSSGSPWLSFVIAAGIILREGFEAVLILIALLAVIRVSSQPAAAAWVHAGWAVALGLGVIGWIFSGWVMAMSGASREMLEAGIAFFAVVVLLSMGFWLHSRTEIHRWKQFIDERVKHALATKNLFALFAISFLAVFREVFETVLFLRAVWLDGGEAARGAMALGVAGSFVALFAGSWALIRYSARIPVRKLFTISSGLMILLALILAGKGMSALQETGFASVTALGASLSGLRVDLLGIYPTRETLLAQLLVLAVAVVLWAVGRRPSVRPSIRSTAPQT